LDFGDDGSGLFMKYIRRGVGYYIDVGASELIADGDVKLKPGQVVGLSANGVLMEDGSELPADLVVCATGYRPMNGWVAQLISQVVADKIGKVWDIGSNTTNDPGPWKCVTFGNHPNRMAYGSTSATCSSPVFILNS